MNIAIIDNSQMEMDKAGQVLKEWLRENKEKCGMSDVNMMTFLSGEELLKYCLMEERVPDIILLEIKLKGIDGLEVAKRLLKYNQMCVIIFLTNYEDYVYDSFKVNAFRYILKPMCREKLPEALLSAVNMIQETDKFFSFQVHRRKEVILSQKIMFLESKKRIIELTMDNHEPVRRFYDSMANVQKRLLGKSFVRCHQSYIVNTRYVEGIEGNIIYLKGGRKIPVSDRYRGFVIEKLLWQDGKL